MACAGSCGSCKKNERTALVTGASSGIGRDIARAHAKNGGNLILVARREDRLDALKAEVESKYGVTAHVIVQDLATPDAAKILYDTIKERNLTVDYLVNDAGFGSIGPYQEVPLDTVNEMIFLHVTTVANLTHLFLKEMVDRNEGRILNVSSLASFTPGPLHATYFATKAFVTNLSEALATELEGTNVTVTALCPGVVEDTEFFEVADMGEPHVARLSGMHAYEVAQQGYNGMIRGDRLIIPGVLNKVTLQSLRFIPRVIVARVAKAFSKRK